MADQIVEISNSGLWLRKFRGFLEVSQGKELVGKVPIDDILSVIISVPGCSITTSLIDVLGQRNIPIVICGSNYLPTSIVFPVQGSGRQFQVMTAQMKLTLPQRKRIWQKIVRSKIKNQAIVLDRLGHSSKYLTRLEKKVKSGDTGNREAQAARFYWPKLFGLDFKRNRNLVGINSALNYTYSIVRSCVARGVISAGLHPTFSVHHRNPRNSLNLVDDLIEPLRPVADYVVRNIGLNFSDEITVSTKYKLAAIVNINVPLFQSNDYIGESPLSLAAARMCLSFAKICRGESTEIILPNIPKPMDVVALIE